METTCILGTAFSSWFAKNPEDYLFASENDCCVRWDCFGYVPLSDPTTSPTHGPTPGPTKTPTPKPTSNPTTNPTYFPTALETQDPTAKPTVQAPLPTQSPTLKPTTTPTYFPTLVQNAPEAPEEAPLPTQSPTSKPTYSTPDPTLSAVPDSRHYVVCGDSSTGCTEGDSALEVDDNRHEVRCCSDDRLTGWTKTSTCPVWGASEIDGVCHSLKKHLQAHVICAAAGARLCTKAELEMRCYWSWVSRRGHTQYRLSWKAILRR